MNPGLFAMLLAGGSALAYSAEPPETASPLPPYWREYAETMEAAKAKYFDGLADDLNGVTQIEVALLTIRQPASEAKEWPLQWPDGPSRWTAAQKTLRGADCQPLVRAMQKAIRKRQADDALCHEPGYGLRMLKLDANGALQPVLESTLCWKCGNFTVPLLARAALLSIPGDEIPKIINPLLPMKESVISDDILGAVRPLHYHDLRPHFPGALRKGLHWKLDVELQYPMGQVRRERVEYAIDAKEVFERKDYWRCRGHGEVVFPASVLLREEKDGIHAVDLGTRAEEVQLDLPLPLKVGAEWSRRLGGVALNERVVEMEDVRAGGRVLKNCAHVISRSPVGVYREDYWMSPDDGFVKSVTVHENGYTVRSTRVWE